MPWVSLLYAAVHCGHVCNIVREARHRGSNPHRLTPRLRLPHGPAVMHKAVSDGVSVYVGYLHTGCSPAAMHK